MESRTRSKTQGWFRSLSNHLQVSFEASARIEHKVTKGGTRETQILDVLRELLPIKHLLRPNVVVVDSTDTESPSFDGILLDRLSFPLVFADDHLVVAMIESVLAAIEVKSSLTSSELKDVIDKARKLRRMRIDTTIPRSRLPRVTAFAYACPSMSLAFYDFSVAFMLGPSEAPNLICILNQGIFTTADVDVRPISPVDFPAAGQAPVLLGTGKDTLLIYLYFLSRWAASGTEVAEVFKQYGGSPFSGLEGFWFEADFLAEVRSNEASRAAARKAFKGHPLSDIKDLYAEARRAVGLPGTQST